MLKNYLKVAIRSIFRHRVYSLINLTGLAVSLAACLLIYQYVSIELSYDSFHENGDDIYRVVPSLRDDSGEWKNYAMSPMPMAPVLAEELPEIRRFTRFTNTSAAVVKVGAKCFTEKLLYADPDMLSMFTFPLNQGDPGMALVDKASVVITESMAKKYFGSDETVGKTVSIKLGGEFRDFTVTGVAADVPHNSTVSFDFLLPFPVIQELWGEPFISSWGAMVTRTYVQLADGTDPASLEEKLPATIARRAGLPDDRLDRLRLAIQPLDDVHLNPGYFNRFEPTINPLYLFVLSGIGFMLLFVACFNFTNISIGLSSVRLKEIGVRKVLGAGRVRLIRQFLAEAMFLSLMALILAVTLAEIILPTFNILTNSHLSAGEIFDWVALPSLLVLLLMVTLLAGAYPALYLSRLDPSRILKGTTRIGGSNLFTRVLIILQFAVSIFFVICTLYMSRQMDFVRKADLGFNADQVLVAPVGASEGRDVLDRLKVELVNNPAIVSMAGSRESMGRESDYAVTVVESEGVEAETFVFRMDENLISTLQMQITQGRNISTEYPSDPGRSVVINEAFANKFGWDDPVGKRIKLGFPGLEDNTGEVVGVVRDFHYLSLHSPIEPAVMFTAADFPVTRIMIRMTPDDIPGTVATIGRVWSGVAPTSPFEYYFLDDDFNLQYRLDDRWGRIIVYSAILAIFISAIGLLGVATLTLSRRTKEIGIRKVLGATVSGIVRQVNREFVILVLLANVLAFPAAYYVMSRWMQNFAYRADIGWTVYGVAAALGAVIALTTVSVQAVRAALTNPVDSLRYE